ncbi:co-chaperone GroES [Candidatus Bipolaricaulota sp. J31]
MKIKPLGNRVLIKKLEQEERKTPGGIVLPESVKDEKAIRGEVVAVGTAEKIEVKEGDKVLVSAYAGTEVRMGEEKYLLVKTTDILAIIEEE